MWRRVIGDAQLAKLTAAPGRPLLPTAVSLSSVPSSQRASSRRAHALMPPTRTQDDAGRTAQHVETTCYHSSLAAATNASTGLGSATPLGEQWAAALPLDTATALQHLR